jgi:hypothetical protein
MASLVVSGDTSGSVTLSAPAVAGTTTLTLPTANGTIITTGSSGQSIPKAALPTGSVLQVVQGSYSTETTNSTSTFADTGLSASITPSAASSKILVLVNHSVNQKSAGSADNSLSLRIVRGSTTIVTFAEYLGYTNSALLVQFSGSYSYLDSPSTTSSTTYKTQFASTFNSNQVRICANNTPATITLLEIAA